MTRPFDLELHIPDGMQAVVPFQFMGMQDASLLYRAYPILPDHVGMALLGSVDRRTLSFGDQDISAVVVGEPEDTSDMYFDWIEQIAGFAVGVHGAPPRAKSPGWLSYRCPVLVALCPWRT